MTDQPMKTLLDTGRYIVKEGSYDEFGKLRFSLDVRVPRDGDAPLLDNVGWYASLGRAEEAMLRHRVNGV